MSERTQFRVYLGIASVLYIWGLSVLWLAHDWGMSEREYLLVAILPVLVGVVCMTMALLSYMELQQENEAAEDEEKDAADVGP